MSDLSWHVTHPSDEVRKVIMENPDLPISVLAGGDLVDHNDDFYWVYASSISCYVGEYLDCVKLDYDLGETVITDRDYLREKLEWYMADEEKYKELSESEFDTIVDDEMRKYDPYWKKAIFIYADA